VGEASGRFYLPQLDGLRFCAFLLVFLHHSPVFPGGSRAAASVKDMGWVGVDLFFVLSAYLLIALLQKEYAATGATDFKKFFIRRALRIWPLFYVYVATCFVHFVATDGEDLTKMTGRTIGHLFFVDNFFSAFSGEYNPLPFTPHLWTIAFEEQIYLFMPLLFMAIVGLRRNNTLFAVTAVAIVVSQPVRSGVGEFLVLTLHPS
jgi:peptidoglycan/LPS O-acetylase OafA/YrhL